MLQLQLLEKSDKLKSGIRVLEKHSKPGTPNRKRKLEKWSSWYDSIQRKQESLEVNY